MILVLIIHIGYGFSLVQYNLLNISGIYDTWVDEREEYIETALTHIAPDILVTQEIFDEEGAEFLLEKLQLAHDDYQMSEFLDGPDTDNMLYYRSSMFSLEGQFTIDTELRDINGYEIHEGDAVFYIFSAHLKASSGSSNERQRYREARELREYIQDNLPEDAFYILCADLNLYGGSERAYEELTSPGHGGFIDPLDNDSEWHNNESLAWIHTQSTRTDNFFGGSTGGLDDRFDFILLSPNFMDDAGVEFLDETYEAIGNDGRHFNISINEYPISGDEDFIDALYHASDHLPVRCEIYNPLSISEGQPLPDNKSIYVFPNPFNSACRIGSKPGKYQIYDITGNIIDTLNGENIWRPGDNVYSGIYIIRNTESGQHSRVFYIK